MRVLFTKGIKMILTILLVMTVVTPGVAAETNVEDIPSEEEIVEVEVSEETEVEDSTEEIVVETTETTEIEDSTEEVVVETTEETVEEMAEETVEENDVVLEVEIEETADVVEGAEVQETSTLSVSDYETFLSLLKKLEEYAAEYAGEHQGEDKFELVINYIRCGVEKYTDGSWKTLAGEEKTNFTLYVSQKDELNGTQVAALRNLEEFTIPNGDTVELGHMFGSMNITHYMKMTNASAAQIYADLSGWGGDLADLMEYTVDKVAKTDVETMTQAVKDNYLGLDDRDAHGFGTLDIYGDLDAFYVMHSISESKPISVVLENYFNEHLTDKHRAAFFIKNRFPGNTSHQDLRNALHSVYSNNQMLKNLEASKGVSAETELRYAVCYAFADYLFELAGDISKVGLNKYYNVFSSEASTLAPGVTQEIKKAMTADDKQIVYYLATVDVTRSDLNIHANYKDNSGEVWGMSRVMDQVNAAVENHSDVANYTPIVATNADFFNMITGEPTGALVMEGVKYHPSNGRTFFAVLEDGTPVLGEGSDWYKYEDQIVEAVGGSAWLIKNGQLAVTETSDYYTSRASRTAIGITADNKVIMMVLDGRQEPVSAGGSLIEIAQIMLDAGCVTALNLDGGGSTTYAAKVEGADSIAVINKPSDGFERSVSSSLLVVSTARPSTEFDHAIVSSDYSYMSVGTKIELTASGVSASGGSAELPEGSHLVLSNEGVGTLEGNIFTATATGTVDVQVVADGVVYGKKTLNVVVPDTLHFGKEYINAIYGYSVELPIYATYNDNFTAINESDVFLAVGLEDAGTLEGFVFTANANTPLRTVNIGAYLISNPDATAQIRVDLYNEDEAMFDFDKATGGNREFAWNREISNTYTNDDINYYIIEEGVDTVVSYVFAIDLSEIEIPEKLKDLTTLLPGGDKESASAWGFMLQMAERVSALSHVEVQVHVDPNFDIDYSDLKLVNDYFTMTATNYDEESHTLNLTVYWIDQSQPIDPATANSICILSGFKFTPKEGTETILDPVMSGDIDFTIYLRANAVYDMAQDPETQEKYDIYPFVNPNDPEEKGGYFSSSLDSFEDKFHLDRTLKNGWVKDVDGTLRYYDNNKAYTGIHQLPEYLNEDNIVYHQFDEEGVWKGFVNGLFEYEGAVYYAVNGSLKTGWNVDGDKTYYLDPTTKQALNGQQKIGGYNYVFTDYVLTRGQLVKDSRGTRYMWAGEFRTQEWVNVDGDMYYAQQNGYFRTGMAWFYDPNGDWRYLLLTDDGLWLRYHNGFYEYDGDIYYVVDGEVIEYPGIVKYGADLYYFTSSSVMLTGPRKYWISKGNGIVPEGSYSFDATGKMVNPPIVDNNRYTEVVFDVGGSASTLALVNLSNTKLSDGSDANVAVVEVPKTYAKEDGSILSSKGMLFAGYFSSEECTKDTAIEDITVHEGKVYAKFVTEDVLNIKAQASAGIKNSDAGVMRIITTVDSLNFEKVGFKVEIEGVGTKTLSTKTVYSTLSAKKSDGSRTYYYPTMIAGESKYFLTINITGIPKAVHNKKFSITPYWETYDGTIVYGETQVKVISELPGYNN